MKSLNFDNAFVRDMPSDSDLGLGPRQVFAAFFSAVLPTPVAAPRLLAWSPEMAAELGFSAAEMQDPAFAEVFGGNALLPGMQPWASNYGGHQFGHWAGQLGDGRAISLGEVIAPSGKRWELQLKGAGMTPYSRGADGRAVLRSSVREFLCSEAMHHLGVPTTRALSLVATGDQVERDMFYDGNAQLEPGAIVCRMAPSFLRFGHYELPTSRGEIEQLRQLVDFTLRRDFPHLHGSDENRYADWFAQVCERTAQMVGHWMRVGFVHGVMNTDNMSILGLTIDYGPYGWIDNYDPEWTPNTTDAGRRRYRFGQQPNVAWWNLSRLAAAIAPLFGDTQPLQQGLDRYAQAWAQIERDNAAAKLGLSVCRDDDLSLMHALQDVMQTAELDMTLTFRRLGQGDVAALDAESFSELGYDAAKFTQHAPQLDAWLQRYRQRVSEDAFDATQREQRMQRSNPCYVLRNYLAQEAIDQATAGDTSGIQRLLEVLRHPYDEQLGAEHYAQKRPAWAKTRAGCSMLSCSS